MIDRLRNVLSGRGTPTPLPATTPTPRTAATIRAELEAARGAIEPLEGKVAAAQASLTGAQVRYDRSLEDFALGLAFEPDRGELQACVSKVDALRRVLEDLRSRVNSLAEELADTERAEALAAGQEQLPELVAAAESRLTRLEETLATANAIESELFELMFGETAGLRQFRLPGIAREAAAARARLRKRIDELARMRRYRVNPRFETDGEINLGADHEWIYRAGQMAALAGRAVRSMHARELVKETGGGR